jgi:hypothetical protein
MKTVSDGITLPHCKTLEELERSANWCILRTDHYQRLNVLPIPSDIEAMQNIWERILAHRNCVTCNSAGAAHFPKVRTARYFTVPLGNKGAKH